LTHQTISYNLKKEQREVAMAVYSLAFVMMRKIESGATEVKPYMQVVATNAPDSIEFSVDFVKTHFLDTQHAADGWEIKGDPVLFEVHEGLYVEWQESMSPAPVFEKPKPKLTLVKG